MTIGLMPVSSPDVYNAVVEASESINCANCIFCNSSVDVSIFAQESGIICANRY